MSPLLPPLNKANVYLGLLAICTLLAVLPETWQSALYYNRELIVSGQYWRLISGHLLHSNSWHLLMNMAGLGLVVLLHGNYKNTGFNLCTWLVHVIVISALLFYFSEEIHVYVGLSGLLHAMLAVGAVEDIQRKLTTGYLLLLGLIAKVFWEQWQGPDKELSELIDASVAIDAHLYGLLSGLFIAMLAQAAYQIKNRRHTQG